MQCKLQPASSTNASVTASEATEETEAMEMGKSTSTKVELFEISEPETSVEASSHADAAAADDFAAIDGAAPSLKNHSIVVPIESSIDSSSAAAAPAAAATVGKVSSTSTVTSAQTAATMSGPTAVRDIYLPTEYYSDYKQALKILSPETRNNQFMPIYNQFRRQYVKSCKQYRLHAMARVISHLRAGEATAEEMTAAEAATVRGPVSTIETEDSSRTNDKLVASVGAENRDSAVPHNGKNLVPMGFGCDESTNSAGGEPTIPPNHHSAVSHKTSKESPIPFRILLVDSDILNEESEETTTEQYHVKGQQLLDDDDQQYHLLQAFAFLVWVERGCKERIPQHSPRRKPILKTTSQTLELSKKNRKCGTEDASQNRQDYKPEQVLTTSAPRTGGHDNSSCIGQQKEKKGPENTERTSTSSSAAPSVPLALPDDTTSSNPDVSQVVKRTRLGRRIRPPAKHRDSNDGGKVIGRSKRDAALVTKKRPKSHTKRSVDDPAKTKTAQSAQGKDPNPSHEAAHEHLVDNGRSSISKRTANTGKKKAVSKSTTVSKNSQSQNLHVHDDASCKKYKNKGKLKKRGRQQSQEIDDNATHGVSQNGHDIHHRGYKRTKTALCPHNLVMVENIAAADDDDDGLNVSLDPVWQPYQSPPFGQGRKSVNVNLSHTSDGSSSLEHHKQQPLPKAMDGQKEARLQEAWTQFYNVFGHGNVPPGWIGNVELAEYVSWQRHLFRERQLHYSENYSSSTSVSEGTPDCNNPTAESNKAVIQNDKESESAQSSTVVQNPSSSGVTTNETLGSTFGEHWQEQALMSSWQGLTHTRRRNHHPVHQTIVFMSRSTNFEDDNDVFLTSNISTVQQNRGNDQSEDARRIPMMPSCEDQQDEDDDDSIVV